MLAPEPAEAAPAETPHEAASGARVLGSLVEQGATSLPPASDQRGAPGGCRLALCPPQCAEVRLQTRTGRSTSQVFPGRVEGGARLPLVKENEMLFSLCFVPAVLDRSTVLRQVAQRAPVARFQDHHARYLPFVASCPEIAPR